MAYPCTLTELERQSFVECPKGSEKPARKVKLCQDTDEEISIGFLGEITNVFNEQTIPADIETLITSFTVPLSNKFNLIGIEASGDNVGKYFIRLNGSKIDSKRSHWNAFNVGFNFYGLKLEGNDVVSVHVINKGNKTAEFEATIKGGLYE